MIEQTIPFPALSRGLARCVREWLLPHLADPMARTQAEVLAALLDGLPDAYGPAVRAAIARENEETRAVLARHGVPTEGTGGDACRSVDELVADTAAAQAALVAVADRLRAAGDGDALRELQAFCVRMAREEVRLATGQGTDFASISTVEDAARRR